jgi:hypothetical protein
MIIEPCCPGRTVTKKILVGGREVGIAGLDDILWKCFELGDASDESRREILLRELRKRNYVPKGAEDEYSEAIWQEFLAARDKLLSKDRGDCDCCGCANNDGDCCK